MQVSRHNQSNNCDSFTFDVVLRNDMYVCMWNICTMIDMYKYNTDTNTDTL